MNKINNKNIVDNNIIDIFKFNNNVSKFLKDVKEESFSLFITGVTSHVNYLLTSATYKQSKKDFVFYVAPNQYKAHLAYDAFCTILGYDNVNLYVVDEQIAIESFVTSNELKQERINTLKSIIENEPKIIVTHTAALLKPILSLNDFKKSIISLRKKLSIDISDITKILSKSGYVRKATTYEIGEFSVRGEVLDIYPSCSDKPIRINFDFDEIESIKYFDTTTQMTSESVEEINIMPMNEIIIWDDINNIKDRLFNEEKENYELINNDFDEYINFNKSEKISKYIKYIDEKYTTITEYVENKIVFYEDLKKQSEVYDNIFLDINNYYTEKYPFKNIELEFFVDFYNYDYNVNKKVFLGALNESIHGIETKGIYGLNSYKVVNYQNDFKMMVKDFSEKKFSVVALSSVEKIDILIDILDGNNIDYVVTDFFNIDFNKINIVLSSNAISFGIGELIEVITDEEIFKQSKNSRVKYRSVNEKTLSLTKTEDLKIGDYVVHYDYGISKYLGIKTVELNDVKNDYLRLLFENMELLVPVEKIEDLEKYLGSEGSVPKLTKIGTNDWEKRKKAVREQLEEIAKDLIEIQIEREKATGVKYQKDSQFQIDFESDFEYEETDDQKRIISEIKKDMEKGLLMDRLVCGDVGFGKTEIAMRAAFKTVYEGKQVVYLAPTTILTRQHYHSFKERFDKYGINVRLLNRLVPLKEQNEIIKDIKTGKAEIVIGTHRLLNNEIRYKDLGLLIIDEEQRFGVGHKEAIKKLKSNVNVLTLTATPIPRTLQMAVTGIRSLSLLETPPKNRYPIQTYVLEYNESVIREAIYRELARGGQVFFLHNRISDIEVVYKKLKKLVPEARICIGNGKMSREELEDVITSFIDKKYDVLLCTTIIETGIDIPNSNTLIVDDATKLGLSQMYQLRGRVGRSDRIAYAYFAYDGNKKLNGQSLKRLEAIKEYTQMGSGYKIAVRDLAIRGAGDILGKEQSGFINSIGIDMYMKLLNEVLNKIKGIEEEKKTNYRIDVSKHVDKGYVSDDDIIIYIHKKISKISTKDEKESVIKELKDRFGKLSNEILTYIEERYLESLLRKYKIREKDVMETSMLATIIIPSEISDKISGDKLLMNGYRLSEKIDFEYNRNHQMLIKIKKDVNDKKWIYLLSELLEKDNFKN